MTDALKLDSHDIPWDTIHAYVLACGGSASDSATGPSLALQVAARKELELQLAEMVSRKLDAAKLVRAYRAAQAG